MLFEATFGLWRLACWRYGLWDIVSGNILEQGSGVLIRFAIDSPAPLISAIAIGACHWGQIKRTAREVISAFASASPLSFFVGIEL